jgi:hypothetical protein
MNYKSGLNKIFSSNSSIYPDVVLLSLSSMLSFPWYSEWLDKDNQEHAQNNIRNLSNILEKYTVKVS